MYSMDCLPCRYWNLPPRPDTPHSSNNPFSNSAYTWPPPPNQHAVPFNASSLLLQSILKLTSSLLLQSILKLTSSLLLQSILKLASLLLQSILKLTSSLLLQSILKLTSSLLLQSILKLTSSLLQQSILKQSILSRTRWVNFRL